MDMLRHFTVPFTELYQEAGFVEGCWGGVCPGAVEGDRVFGEAWG